MSGLRSFLVALILLLGVLAVLVPSSPAQMPVPHRDSGVFLYTGWRILEGDLPYRDAWDHKPPAVYYLNAVGLALGGGSRWGVWWLEVGFLWAAAWLGFVTLNRVFGFRAAAAATYLLFFSLFFPLTGGNLTSEYALPFQFAILFLVVSTNGQPVTFRRAYTLGVLVGILFFIRQTAIGTGLAAALFWMTRPGMSQFRVSERVRRIFLPVVLGWTTAAAVFLICLGYHQILGDFWDAAFLYNFAYSAVDFRTRWISLVIGINSISRGGLAVVGMIGLALGLLEWKTSRNASPSGSHSAETGSGLPHPAASADSRGAAKGGPLEPVIQLAILAFMFEFGLISVTGRSHPHTYLGLLPPLTLAAGYAVRRFADRLTAEGHMRSRIDWVLVGLLAGFTWLWAADVYRAAHELQRAGDPRLATAIQAQVDPGQSVLVWGADPVYNFLARRISPTRYSSLSPLFQPGYGTQARILDFLEQIQADPPRWIIDTQYLGTPAFHFPQETNLIRDRLMDLRSGYRLREMIGPYAIYERNK